MVNYFMRKLILNFALLLLLSNTNCSVFQTISNIGRLKFKIGNLSNFTLNGIAVSNKSKMSDFSVIDLLKLSSAFAQGSLPVSFIINVEAVNPNDGTGGYPSTNATLKSFAWRLLLDERETVSGNISQPIDVPATGQAATIPLQVNLDLIQFFNDESYENLINLVLNLGGYAGKASQLTLNAKPVVSTMLGDLSYPQEIKIVDFQYTK